MRRLFPPLLALALAIGPIALGSGASPAAAASATPASFTTPMALNDGTGTTTNGSEPSIHIDSKDNVYVSAPVGVETGGCPFWYVHADGKSYDYRGTIDTDQRSVGGGDCDISSLPASGAFDDVSVTSLSLANLTSNATTDGGATWRTIANPVSQQVFGVDRQWQASDPGLGRHYLTVHDLSANIQVSVSTDGGYQYVQNTFAIDPQKNRKALSSGVSISVVDGSNHFGALVVDPTTHHLFIPFLAPLEGTTGFKEHTLYISEGDPCPGGQCTLPTGGPAPISWTTYQAFSAPVTDNLSNDFPALTMGTDGTLYAAFTGAVTNPASSTAGDTYSTSRIFVLHATAPHSATAWSTPKAIDPGTGNSNVFPWLVAGSAGNVGVAWYSSTLAPNGPCPGAGAAGNGTSVSDNCLNTWHVAYAQSADASTTAPTWAVSDISGPIHKGPICNVGLNCATGTRTLLDFFDVAIDKTGRANIAFVSDARQIDVADVMYTRQCGGTSLTGATLNDCTGGVAPVACPANGAYTDPAGDATNVLGNQTPVPSDDAFDIVGGSFATTADDVVLTVSLKDLTNAPDGQIVEQHFTIAGKEYYVMATRPTGGGAVTYVYGDMTTGTVPGRRKLGDTTGTFDDTNDVVTTAFPRAATTPALADGTVISGLAVTTRRDGQAAIPDVDTAVGPCPYAVGAAADPVVPEIPYSALLPTVAVALFGVLYYRRRRRMPTA